jgi:acetyl-CoA carboxylase carboxyltransferase component
LHSRDDRTMSASLILLKSPVHGSVVGIEVEPGQAVARGQVLMLVEAMKMELTVEAPAAGRVLGVRVAIGDVVQADDPVLDFEAGGVDEAAVAAPAAPDLDAPRADLAAVQALRALTQDAARPQAMARRHTGGGRSARENVADLVDAGSWVEYGALAVAAQRSRRTLDDLRANTPADGLITGHGQVDGRPVAVLAYDYTVLAGTQGVFNHKKSDRLLELAERWGWPVVLFAEGGGGRPGDVDWPIVAGLDCKTFARYAALSGRVPRIGIVHGRCFAGNAALLGCSDVIVATRQASIGMGGPAMIEGGGLGRVDADAVGPAALLAANGVIDVLVDDEGAAVRVAKQVLRSLSALATTEHQAADQRSLRHAVPANRNAAYDVRAIVATLADTESMLELRREFGIGVVTALARIGGRAVGIAASNVHHLGGALDAPACDKLTRFMQLLDAFGLPLVTLVDTPGFMVGPASEATAMVRHASRVFIAGAALRVPVFAVMLRRGYGLGAMAMAGGHFHAPVATVSWPSGEFGAMGLEGSVRLGFRKELEAAGDERDALFKRLLDEAIARGRASEMASHLEVDDVIDPATTRDWLVRGLAAAAARPLPPRRAVVDAW